MQHRIPVEQLGADGRTMARAVEACVHCGFCLPACPTYRVLGEEMDSPRGRILLMKSGLEGAVAVRDTLPFIDRCLGCLACATACPSGVAYGELLPLYRAHAAPHRPAGAARLAHALLHRTLASAGRFRLALLGARVARPFAFMLPAALASLLALAPRTAPRSRPLPRIVPANGPRRARVVLLAGCAQQVLAPEIGAATIAVLARNGVEVIVPPGQGCCGALALHAGDLPLARDLARVNLTALAPDADAVVTNAAGCGSAMKAYARLFEGQPEETEAAALAARVRDVSEFLDALGLAPPPPLAAPLTVAYHDPCHLSHAQGITAAPRRLLGAVGNLSLVEAAEGDICCGSAGTYNIEQPALAAALGERKARHLLATGAQAVVTGNIGCIVQIRAHLDRLARPLPVLHTMEILDRAYRSGPSQVMDAARTGSADAAHVSRG
jgi:glycolate oxidase iron-sulfur subunit